MDLICVWLLARETLVLWIKTWIHLKAASFPSNCQVLGQVRRAQWSALKIREVNAGGAIKLCYFKMTSRASSIAPWNKLCTTSPRHRTAALLTLSTSIPPVVRVPWSKITSLICQSNARKSESRCCRTSVTQVWRKLGQMRSWRDSRM